MNRVLKGFVTVIKAIGSIFTGSPNAVIAAIEKGLLAAKPYFEDALEISEWVAAFTPTPADDLVISFVKKYSVDASQIMQIGRPQGDITRDLIRLALQKRFPDAADRWLNRAIELAYSKVNP